MRTNKSIYKSITNPLSTSPFVVCLDSFMSKEGYSESKNSSKLGFYLKCFLSDDKHVALFLSPIDKSSLPKVLSH